MLKKILTVAALVAVSTAASATEVNSRSEGPSFIVGGMSAEAKNYPWLVKLNLFTKNCNGTIIDTNWVLTSAQCFFEDGKNLLLEGNSDNTMNLSVFYNKNGYTLDMVNTPIRNDDGTMNVFLHDSISDGWVPTDGNDIALVHLQNYKAQYEEFSGFPANRAIKLLSPAEHQKITEQEYNPMIEGTEQLATYVVSGYQKHSTLLDRTYLASVNPSDTAGCDTGSLHCAKTPVETFVTTVCKGGEGIPLVWKNPDLSSTPDFGLRLAGIASQMSESCNTFEPVKFVNVESHVETADQWISSTIQYVTGNPFVQPESTFSYDPLNDMNMPAYDDDGEVNDSNGNDSNGNNGFDNSFDNSDGGGSASFGSLLVIGLFAAYRAKKAKDAKKT